MFYASKYFFSCVWMYDYHIAVAIADSTSLGTLLKKVLNLLKLSRKCKDTFLLKEDTYIFGVCMRVKKEVP